MRAWSSERELGDDMRDDAVPDVDRDLLTALALVDSDGVEPPQEHHRGGSGGIRPRQRTSRASSSTGIDSPPNQVAAPRRHAAARSYKRDEVALLRDTAAALTDRLRILKLQVDRKLLADSRTESGPVDPMLSVAWEEVVAQQYALRREAEMENARLRAMLDEQIRFGRSLTRVLNRPIDTELLSVPMSMVRLRCHTTPSAWDTTHVFDELVAQLPHLYADTARMFDTPVFRTGERSFFKSQVKEDPATASMYIAMSEAREAPFDLETVAEEMWRILTTHPGAPTLVDELDLFVEGDAARLQLIIPARCGGNTTCDFVLQVATRRFIEPDRVVIVWCGQLTPTNTSDQSLDGVCIRHKAWELIEPIPADELGDASAAATRARSLTFSIPAFESNAQDVKRKVGTLINFVRIALREQLKGNREALENRLLAHAARREKCPEPDARVHSAHSVVTRQGF